MNTMPCLNLFWVQPLVYLTPSARMRYRTTEPLQVFAEDVPPGNDSRFAIRTMSHLVRWFTTVYLFDMLIQQPCWMTGWYCTWAYSVLQIEVLTRNRMFALVFSLVSTWYWNCHVDPCGGDTPHFQTNASFMPITKKPKRPNASSNRTLNIIFETCKKFAAKRCKKFAANRYDIQGGATQWCLLAYVTPPD